MSTFLIGSVVIGVMILVAVKQFKNILKVMVVDVDAQVVLKPTSVINNTIIFKIKAEEPSSAFVFF